MAVEIILCPKLYERNVAGPRIEPATSDGASDWPSGLVFYLAYYFISLEVFISSAIPEINM